MSTQSNSHEAVSRSGSDLAQPGGTGTGEQAHITCSPQVVKNSIDTLHLTLWVDLSKSDLIEKISEARDVARSCELDKVPFTYFSTDFNVHRSGRRHFQYHISCADTHIFFNKREVEGSFPTCLIEIGSLSSWCPGPFQVYKNIKSYFDFAGLEVVKHNVSRVDLASDFIDQDFDSLDMINNKKWIKRANKFAAYYSGSSSTGVSVGSGNIMLRVYDKTREMSDKKASGKQKFFEKIWGVKDKKVVRVEFQFRREFLKEFRFGPNDECEVHTIDELEKAQNALWCYGSRHWARHTEKEVDSKNKNQSQSKVSSFWFLVQQSSFNSIPNKHQRKKRVKEFVNVDALVAQAAGCLQAVAACSMDSVDNISQCIKIAKEKVSESLFLQYINNTSDFCRKISTVQASNRLQFHS